MNAVSLFSGAGGFDLGIHRAGFRVLVQAELDPYRRDVLRARFDGTVYDDVRAVGREAFTDGLARVERDGRPRTDAGRDEREAGRPDLLFGGFPCQDLSVAGKRAGLAGDRSGLFFEFVRVAEALRPRAVLLENVPGLLSSNGGRDFGTVLGALADVGYGVAWRVLDSRFFGVPQRRRRVFILGVEPGGRAGAERAGQILAVGTRCAGHPPTGSQEGPEPPDTPISGTLGGRRGFTGDDVDRGGHTSLSGLGNGGPDDNDAQAGRLVVARALTSAADRQDGTVDTFVIANTLRSQERNTSQGAGNYVVDEPYTFDWQLAGSERSWIADTPDHTRSLTTSKTLAVHIAAPLTSGSHPNSNAPGRRKEDDENLVATSITLASDPIHAENLAQPSTKRNGDPGVVQYGAVVRRLTPTECERLQGCPDGWTQLGGTADSKRYAALGDMVTVPVAEWLGRRIAAHLTPSLTPLASPESVDSTPVRAGRDKPQ